LPHILASRPRRLSGWVTTPVEVYRSEIFKQFRARTFRSLRFYPGYQRYVDLLVKTGCINDGKKIWWDCRRIHSSRRWISICDIPNRVTTPSPIAALFQAIGAKLTKLLIKTSGFRLYRAHADQENKWRAVRWGLDGMMIDFGKQKESATRDSVLELLGFP